MMTKADTLHKVESGRNKCAHVRRARSRSSARSFLLFSRKSSISATAKAIALLVSESDPFAEFKQPVDDYHIDECPE